jgi:hypothetical protein
MMYTPQQLFDKYKKEVCPSCNKKGNCDIHIVKHSKVVTAKCTDYKRADYCMQHKCNTCKKNIECFGEEE